MYRTSQTSRWNLLPVIFLSFLFLNVWILAGQPSTKTSQKWVATWSTAPQLVETRNNPPAPGLSDNSLRQVVRISIGGEAIRLKLTNEYSKSPVVMHSVQIAASTGGSTIDPATNLKMTFNGKQEITIAPGTTITSDPIKFTLKPRMDVTITIYYGSSPADVTGHPGSRTISYLFAGNNSSVTDFTGAVETEHWYNINTIDVLTTNESSCIAVLGNSITDGRGSTTNKQNRWPDLLAERLLASQGTNNVGVLNLGIGGNCVLRNCLGPAGVNRYKSDILDQAGVQAVIIFEGVNDIGAVRTAEAAASVASGLIDAYKKMIGSARSGGLKIFGATITPIKGNGYYNEFSESCRQEVNKWIRSGGAFDAVFDFDLAVRNPEDPISLASSFQNDGLHPDLSGFRKMADCIDLKLFEYSGAAKARNSEKSK